MGVRSAIVVAMVMLVAAGLGCGSQQAVLHGMPRTECSADPFTYEPMAPAVSNPAPDLPALERVEPTPTKPTVAARPAGAPGWEPTPRPRAWRWIVIHHSATDHGNAEIFDRWHREGNHWDELGYHFVIGNGTDSGDGLVEVGSRWHKQKHGAHCRVGDDQTYNQTGIGICLVGNFHRRRPSDGQMKALARLVDWLATRYDIGLDHVIGHGWVDDTDCPGRHFSFDELRRRIRARRRARKQVAAAKR